MKLAEMQQQEQLWRNEELRVAIQKVVDANRQAGQASPFRMPWGADAVGCRLPYNFGRV